MTATTPTPTDRSPRALLLASDPAASARLREALERRGFEVRAAADGVTGIALLLDGLLELDVVVTDRDLPGRDARSLVHLVRGPGGEHDLAIVVLAPGADAPARGRLVAAGADAVTAGLPDASADAAVAAVARRQARAREPGLPAPARPPLARRARTFPPVGALALRPALGA